MLDNLLDGLPCTILGSGLAIGSGALGNIAIFLWCATKYKKKGIAGSRGVETLPVPSFLMIEE